MTPTPAPAGLPSLPVVAWFTEHDIGNMVWLDKEEANTYADDEGPEPLVKLSDAMAAISDVQQKLDDMTADYLRRHREACELKYGSTSAAQQEGQKQLAACDGGGVTQWQPIETAPKWLPGTERQFVLLWCPNAYNVERVKVGYVEARGAAYSMYEATGEMGSEPQRDATHWMPLPTSPEAK